MKTKRRVYFNKQQIRFAFAPQKTRVLIAGRGFGKSAAIALILYRLCKELPRGKCFLSSTILEQIENNTLAPIQAKLGEMGLIEGIHYVVNLNPWKNAKTSWFKKPYKPINDFSHTMTFFNGFTVVFLSAAKPTGKRGGSFDAGIVDEAAFVKRGFFEQVLVKMVRDNVGRYESPLHHSIYLMSSQPRTPEGMWLLEFEKKAIEKPEKVFFMWESARANTAVLGAEWFDTQKTLSSDLDYRIEVENERLKKLPDGFYHKLEEGLHGYKNRLGSDVRQGDLLEASFDFGGKFNCASIWQEQDFTERCLRQFFVKDTGKIRRLVDDICDHYSNHEFKYIRLWGEPRGRDRNPIDDDDIFTIIQKRFIERGWTAEIRVLVGAQAKTHKERFDFIEAVMDERSTELPRLRVNLDNCPDLWHALATCDIAGDFQKDKRAERDPNFPQEHAPHFTDTVDNYLYPKHAWRRAGSPNHRPGGVATG